MAQQLGRYEILEKIGEGGFAVVYRARDTALDRNVALKALKPILLRDTAWVERFRREAKVIARLDHTRITPIYDVGETEDRLFIVMRLVSGPSLAELLATRKRLSWTETIEIISAVAEGLDYAHSQGVLHRDLKPANILLDPERGPLLTDFGMAKLTGDSSLSATGDIVGTPHYIAPETWEGQPATPQADIFALGCVLFEMLVGDKVFPGETPLAVMNAHLKGVEFPETWPESVPSGVADVMSTALSKKPAQRFATANEMIGELARLSEAPSSKEKVTNMLEIFTFGGLRIQRDGNPVSKIGSKRVEALLVYLACSGQPHPRELLADLLWDDRPQKQVMSNLRTVLTGLRKQFGSFVTITRNSVGLNPEATIWRDTEALAQALASVSFEDTIELYRGNFLDGFYLRGARAFEEWLILERENWQQQLQSALSQSVTQHLARNNYNAGIPIAGRLLQFDPLLEDAHRQLMRLLALSGQRSAALAQYETCRQILEEELGVEPSAETTTLYEQIQADTLKPVPALPPTAQPVQLPTFLDTPAEAADGERALFVARENELTRLNNHLVTTIEGNGQVVLVTGEAGRGKTSLLTEFARQAQETYPALIVASGTCNAYSGLGDPYLPFREVMAMLTADVETRWTAGIISREHARRLWRLLPQVAQALVERGPNLIELLVSGEALTGRLAASGTEGKPWIEQISALTAQTKTDASSLEQAGIFEQVGQVLQALAANQPLLLIFDDLQWADSASVSLLFHLARQLVGQNILIVGAYRPIDIQADLTSKHPFMPVAGEIKRLFGDIELDLGKTPSTEGRAFIDALLDNEPNTLDESFRAAMFHQTQGHPLFTVELLRDMQERGDLVQDENGLWVEARPLDWSNLPARVEAVIEQRLNRLDEDTQDMLAIAAVEGEIFTVQVVARLHEISERKLLRLLSRTLGKQHRLVREQGEVTVGEQTLSRFQFRHALFQQYLYNQLSPGERRLLHTDVAAVIEELYAGHTDEITVALARHYTEAGQGGKAIPHLLHAGDQARLAYAHEAAIEHYRQAVIFLKEQGDNERAADTLMKLGLTYHSVFEFEQSRQAYDEAFSLRQVVSQTQSFVRPFTHHTFRVLWPDEPPTLDPALIVDSILIEQLFSGLVEATSELDVVPDMAQRWEVLDGGWRYVFYLRDDIRWSDGTPVTAHDFEYAWKRILDPVTGSPAASLLYDVKGARAFHCGEAEPETVGVKALDAVTLAIELEGPNGYFLSLLTHSVTYPVPRHTLEAHSENWTAVENIVTNGPFRMESWQRGERLVLTRNELYHGRFQGNVKKVECLLLGGDIWSIADWDTRSLALYEAGDLDVMFIAEAVGQAQQKYAEDHVSFPMFWTIYLSFDLSKPPFNDHRVRRAFVLAIDTEWYQTEVTKGLFVPATGGFLPPEMQGHSAGIGLPHDPAQARRLLAEAGYPDGHHFPKVKALGGTKQEAEYVQAQWRKNLGVEVEWEVLDFVTAHEMASREIPALFFVAWGAKYPDPDNFLRVCFQQPYHNWHNETYDRLIEEARQLTDQEKRIKLYQQADQILLEEIPLAPLFYGRLHFLVRPWVRNLRIAPTWEAFWKDVIIESSHQPARPSLSATFTNLLPTLRLSWLEPPTLDPTLAASATDIAIIEQIFSGLVTYGEESEVVPDVAQSWEVTERGHKYIFHLRDDVVWSDGRPVIAGDFEYAWKRLLDPATRAVAANMLYDLKGAKAFHQGELSDSDQVGVYALDEVTLVVELEQPTSYFLQLMSIGRTYPVPEHVVDQFGQSWAQSGNIVSNGPFRVENWNRGEIMILERNPGYHGQFTGNVQHVEMLMLSDWTVSLGMYRANDLDVLDLEYLPPLQKEHIHQLYAGEHVSTPLPRTSFVGFNPGRPPFDDLRVRRAFVLAIDQAALTHTILKDLETTATGGLVPPGIPGHSSGIGLTYQPDRAQQLLTEAGYPAGRGFPVVKGMAPVSVIHQSTQEFLAAQWRMVLGVEIVWETTVEGTTAHYDKLFEMRPSLFIGGWVADYPDPDSFLEVGIRGEPIEWQNETYDRLIEEGRRITDPEERLELYRQADKILIDNAIIMPLYYARRHVLVKPWVKNYPSSIFRWWYWKDVIIAPSQQPIRSQPAVAPLTAAARTLRMALNEPTTLDPTQANDWSIQDQLFSGLVSQSQDLQIIPDVAQSWEILDDGRKYIFHLRPDVRWSDGTPLTAADFEFAWKRVLAPRPVAESPLASLMYDIKGARAFYQGEVSDADQVGIQALDEVTLAVEMEAPTGYFLHLLSSTIAYPVPRHVVEAHGDNWTTAEHIVTNGPFRVESWDWHDSAVLVRNPSYHGQFEGNVERVELKLSPWDPSANLKDYEAGQLDVVYNNLSFPESERMRRQLATEYKSIPWLQTCYIGFDTNQPPFDDPRVRRAFAMSIDKTRLEKSINSDEDSPVAGGFIPPGLPGHSPDIGLPYNPNLARQLLAEAGYPDGRDFPQISWMAFSWAHIAEYLQKQWNEILGVGLPPGEVVHMADFPERFRQVAPRLFLGGWVADYPDPDSFLRIGLLENNPGWVNDSYSALVEQARRLTNQEARIKLYQQADKILVDDAVTVPVTYGRGHLLQKPWVKKYPTSPASWWFWKDVIIEAH